MVMQCLQVTLAQQGIRIGIFNGPKQTMEESSRDLLSHFQVPQLVFLGLEVQVCSETSHDSDKPHYNHILDNKEAAPQCFGCYSSFSVSINDGNYTWDIVTEDVSLDPVCPINEKTTRVLLFERLSDYILQWISNYRKKENVKVVAIGICNDSIAAKCKTYAIKMFASDKIFLFRFLYRLWIEHDILPVLTSVKGESFEERAFSAAEEIIPLFQNTGIVRTMVGYKNRVIVDLDKIHYVHLHNYKATVPEETFHKLLSIVNEVLSIKLKSPLQISFFNSTPQGGGVALMRHSIIRMAKLLKLPISWFVLRPNAGFFHVTKRKIHNLLQGVSAADVELSDTDIELYKYWTEFNAKNYWTQIFENSSIIILDDPQVVGLIPKIKEVNPNCKIIFRSHIEIRTDLIRTEGSPQQKVWKFLWSYIKDCHAFVFHPIPSFVPDEIPRNKLYYIPARSLIHQTFTNLSFYTALIHWMDLTNQLMQ